MAVDEIFAKALAKSRPAERTAYLDEACADTDAAHVHGAQRGEQQADDESPAGRRRGRCEQCADRSRERARHRRDREGRHQHVKDPGQKADERAERDLDIRVHTPPVNDTRLPAAAKQHTISAISSAHTT